MKPFFLLVLYFLSIPLVAQIISENNKNDLLLKNYSRLTYQPYSSVDLICTGFIPIDNSASRNVNSDFNWPLLLSIGFGILVSIVLVWFFNQKSLKSRYENRYPNLGGWLILVAMGCLFTPLYYLLGIYRHWDNQKYINYAFHYFHEQSNFFSPLKGFYTLLTNFFNAVMLVYSIFVVTLFFQKRVLFRPHYVLFKLITLLLFITDVWMIYHFSDGMPGRTFISKPTTWVRISIAICIWVPYVWFSERSRHTFTNEKEEEEELLHF